MTKFTTTEKPYRHFGLASYRIEVDLADVRRPRQRHIWTREDGSVDVDEWIDSIRTTEAERPPTANTQDSMKMWEPIETAPKDASTVLLATMETSCQYAVCRLGYWTRYGENEGWYAIDDDRPLGIRPTHWMRIPPLPLEVRLDADTEWDD